MILLYFVDNLKNSGGIQRMLTNKINYLANTSNYNIHVICYEKGSIFFPIDERVNIHYLDIANSTDSLKEKLWKLPLIVKRTISLIKKIGPDIIINENMKTMTFILPFILRKIPKIYVIHFSYNGLYEINNNIYKHKSIKKTINQIRVKILKLYTRFVVLTEYDKEKWNLPNVQVIPNFTNIKVSKQSNLSSQNAIFVGRFSYEKDVPILIKAWAIVSQEAPEWHLHLYGDGTEKKNIQELIRELRLEKSIEIKGNVRNIEEAYLNSSLLIVPSRFEGFVLVILEALTLGVPCISFDIPGCNNLIVDRKNGFLVKRRSPAELANTILKYIQLKQEEKIEMQKKIKDTIQKYSKEEVMQQWIDLFSEISK